jgi:hypothetical protein
VDDNDHSQELAEPRQLLEAPEVEPAYMAIIGPGSHIKDVPPGDEDIPRDIKMTTDVGFDFSDVHDLHNAVYQSIGAASVCWENPGGAGVFDSTRAAALGEGLIAWLVEHGFPDSRGFPDGPGR